MTKQEKEQILHAYLDNELGARERVEMEEALDAEPTLRAELRFYRKMRQQLQEAPRKLASLALAGRIQARLEGEVRTTRWTGFWQAGMAAGMACAMTAVIFFWSRQSDSPHLSVGPSLAGSDAQKATPTQAATEPFVQGSTPVAEGSRPSANEQNRDAPSESMFPAESTPNDTRLLRCPRKYKAWLRQRAQERQKAQRLQALRLLRMYHPSLVQPRTVVSVPSYRLIHPPTRLPLRPLSRSSRSTRP
ncbi:hypothetical protein L6R29_13985 [Myxococcota bacterium]|nr:hypothetical protein [Myxococcota bacterium]